MTNNIIPIPAFNDNYIWTCVNPNNKTCMVVDPGDAQPVINYLSQNGLDLKIILVTHHHFDHTGGVKALVNRTGAQVYGPKKSTIGHLNHRLLEGDAIHLPELELNFKVLEIPGHTLDHIAYYNDESLFCGDTLFSGGCGRLFEGTAAQMVNSLDKLTNLDNNLKVYCAHEYTQHNLAFAKLLEPNNTNLLNHIEKIKQLRSQNQPSLPSSIELEKAINPFLRCQEPEVIASAQKYAGKKLPNLVDVFAQIRLWKDGF